MDMKIFLVGGAVRDELLGLPVKDRDWVVTGATPEDMSGLGYRPVGQDFPVFLHPETNEEYALARTEKKSGHGYAGFIFHTSPDTTLEEDLKRRDLTVNAIAKDQDGELIDPYGGLQDLEKRILRHVSPAFREDPLRILRVARFSARFKDMSFSVARETRRLMKEMVQEGEAAWLVAERVWQETARALDENAPSCYFMELSQSGALDVVMPEIADLYQGDNSFSSRALTKASSLKAETVVRFACACCTLQENNQSRVQALCKRLKVPKQFKEVAELTAMHIHLWLEDQPIPAPRRLSLLQQADAFRRSERFKHILSACSILAQADNRADFITNQLIEDLSRCRRVEIKDLVEQGLKGKELAEAIQNARLSAMSL